MSIALVLVVACKSAAEKQHEGDVRARPSIIQRARAAADNRDWSAALDALYHAANIEPLSPDETQLEKQWQFRKVVELYCAGKVDELVTGPLEVPDAAPPGLEADTVVKAKQLLSRRDVIRQVRDLREQQRTLSQRASEEPQLDEDCKQAISAVQSARTVSLNILRKIESDYGPGIYEVQDATGQTARLTTTDTVFTTTGWATVNAYAFNDNLIIELSKEKRAKAQSCLADQQTADAARAEFATSSRNLDSKIAALSNEFIASCASPVAAATPAPPPAQPEPTAASPTPAPTSTPPDGAQGCTIDALNCGHFSTQGRTGRALHALAFAAEQAGRHAAAICLARSNLNSSDRWLAGAANFDSSRAWEALGCHDAAVAAIETSLSVRPRDQGGWTETCEQCHKIGGTCVPCSGTSTGKIVDASQPPTDKATSTDSQAPTTAGSPAAPVQVYLVGYHGPAKDVIQFQGWENGKLVLKQGPGTIEVVPGTPRTLVIKSITSGSDGVLQGGYKNKTLVVDGKTPSIEFDMDPLPNCRSALVDPKLAECRQQFCEINKSDPKCGLE